ncbi:hypothetical protein PRZ48_003815 [Zasmidium cellare]|uniref:F-box domain-containing protein n=1 Tax=Zasmidium cellare TaxID=395010 RepID=A0ABR0EWQ2_ZASCE|nr:hypothetical protein PRZ48_003815 [Zasmidium cellare]
MAAPVKLLNPDVLREVFLRLSKYDLLDVACVCREWNFVAQRLIYQTLEIVASVKMQEANLHLLQRLQQDAELQHRVKSLTFKDWYLDDLPPWPIDNGHIEDPWMPGKYFSISYIESRPMGPDSEELMLQLCAALKMMSLSSFTWSALAPIPIQLVETLETQTSCSIHIRRNERAYDVAVWSHSPILNHAQLQNMARVCSQLTTLDLLIPSEDPLILSALGNLIVSSSRLKSLKLYVLGKLWGGSKVFFVPTRPARGTVFAPVRSMEWLQRPLLTAGRQLELDELELDNFCVCGVQGLSLSDITDVSRLRRIGLSCFSFLCKESGPWKVRFFRLHCRNPRGFENQYCSKAWSESMVQELLSQCHSLTEIELLDGREILNEPLLELIGTELASLTLRQTIWPESATGYDLDLVSRTCPNLRTLAIDIPHEKTFSQFCSSVTTTFPVLSELSIRRGHDGYLTVDFYTPDPHRYTSTLSDLHTAWTELAAEDSSLVNLTLHYDSWKPWDRDVDFFHTGRPYDVQAQIPRRTFVVQANVPKRMAQHKQDVKTKCLEVEEARRALKHRWQWLDGYFRGQTSWQDRLHQTEKTATEGHNLVLRRTPNALGEFTQRAM